MSDQDKARAIKAARYIAVTFALGMGARFAIKGFIKMNEVIDQVTGYTPEFRK